MLVLLTPIKYGLFYGLTGLLIFGGLGVDDL
jgi:hypothetical protein